jgi:triacylglycerol lipase
MAQISANTQAARDGLLIMYAWDMCDLDIKNVAPAPDARIASDGWTLVGYITGADDIITSGNTIRRNSVSASANPGDRVCYGYLAVSQTDSTQHVAVIRGTDGAEEWADDFDFFMQQAPKGYPGYVDQGFYSIYASMQYVPLGAATAINLADGIAQAVGANSVKVLGHSLGSALSTYLMLDLAVGSLTRDRVSACLFASPRTGNAAFTKYVDANAGAYDLFNYDGDLVTQVPLFDALKLSAYEPLANVTLITDASSESVVCADKLCAHHVICYVSRLSYSEFLRGIALQGTTQDDCKCAACVTGKHVPDGGP